jgi:Fe-S cluster biogenesis protein NfuA
MAEQGREPVAVALDDEAVRARIGRLNELLEHLERMPGPTTEMALEAVQTLTAVYGSALERVVARAAGVPALAAALVEDELLNHLLALHGIHPDPVEQRVARALDEVRPYLNSHGGEVELAGIEQGVARVRLSGSCGSCSSSSATLEYAVTDAVLAVAPELSGVESVPAERGRTETFIPVDALLRKPATTGRRT